MNAIVVRRGRGIGFALLLGCVLLLLSYLRIGLLIGTDAFHSTRVVAETLPEPLWRTRLGLNILLFACSQLAVHLAFAAVCWTMAAASSVAWPRAGLSRCRWILLWFVVGAAWLMVANASLFPRSSLGAPYKAVGNISLLGVRLHVLIGACIAGFGLTTCVIALLRTVRLRRLGLSVAGSLTVVAITAVLLQITPPANADSSARPNIILLGIDSLRPDFVTAANTPHLRAFLDGSTRLSDAVTPLARTFPSWVSILTGRHPHTTGAVMNLLPRELIHEGATLPALLRQQGYRAVYAIDETRFSNVDESYGFDAAVMPPTGGSDFVLAWFADAPLSNLLMNTRVGAFLFPFQHANRAAFVTYDPDSFVRRVAGELDTRQPLFLALHLTLPHWPFEWSDSALPTDAEAPDHEAAIRWKYGSTVHRADEQFGDLLRVLDRKGLLANAIVVALSDHGEAFGHEEGFVADAIPDEDPSVIAAQETGHGTSVFSPHQYRTVLGFRGYGKASALLPPPSVVPQPVSLLDVAPTVLELVGTTTPADLDGMSLMPLFRGESGAARVFESRIRFTESEYNPGGFDISNITGSALAHAAMIYRVDPRTDRLQVRGELVGILLGTRQYAALLGDAFGGAVPQPAGGGPYRFIYRPGAGGRNAQEEALLRSSLEKRFGIEFAGATVEISTGS